ncbi:hypothetical protein ABZ791_30345 [Streptomyces huasconensis]|uniref:Uncharacterized protein n=1 Tax=Streptomyces huasconensis TaxID=1854574 RepID=A0ABV3M362_9ACTN
MNHDDHIQHTWNLTHPNLGDLSIDLWTDDDTVSVDGGDGEQCDGGRRFADQLLGKYQALGYLLTSDYPVNDPHDPAADEPDESEPADKPEGCPECGSTDIDFAPNHVADLRQGDAWLCTGCNWGQWTAP